MHCPSCNSSCLAGSKYCPSCGKDLRIAPLHAPTLVVEGQRGPWAWVLASLLLAERGIAYMAFPLERVYHVAASWERPFLWAWGLGLGMLCLPLVVTRRRAGGWLAFFSGMALIVRACVPLIEPEPLGQAAENLAWSSTLLIGVFFVAGATVTFAFLFEQSFWKVREADPLDFPEHS